MADPAAPVVIPNRALFKAAEVCELAHVQPYVLRSWEAEFPGLGVAKAPGSARVYRRADVEQVLRIRHLLLVDGLTLAGARRRLDEEATPVAADLPGIDELIGRNARERLTDVKRGLRSILDLLTGEGIGQNFRMTIDDAPGARRRPAAPARAKGAHVRRVVVKRAAKRAGSARRKRST